MYSLFHRKSARSATWKCGEPTQWAMRTKRRLAMGMKSSESDLPFFDCEPPGPAGECLRFCRPFFMTYPFFGFGLPPLQTWQLALQLACMHP